jgi:MFS family permease
VYSLSAHTTRMSPGYALASVALIGNAGFLLGPLLIGYLSEIFSMQWAFGMVSLFSLSISFLALKVRQEKKALDLRAEKSLRQ